MTFKNLITIICLSFLFVSCNKEENDDRISYEITQDHYFSYSEEEKIPKQFKVFRDENEWNDFILEIERVVPGHTENLKNLNLNFIKNNFIIVIGEFYNRCCSRITINDVSENSGKITVDFDESGPGEATALSQAYLILKIKKDL